MRTENTLSKHRHNENQTNMKQRFTSFLLMVLSCAIIYAGPVGLEQARAKAAKFMKGQNGGTVTLSETPEYAPARSIKGVPTDVSSPAYYVFNTEADNGYVIVSGDDRTDEILGYATQGSFDIDNMPENVKAWLQGYAEQIAMLETYVPQPQNVVQYNTEWTAIAPLTKTKWNQSAPYNNQCPIQDGERSVTGCTATAMAQVMKYHEWPEAPTQVIPAYQTTTFKFTVPQLNATTFRWNEMQNTYEQEDNGDAVAELMRYCGQSILSDYTKLSTGAYTTDVAIALTKYFDYDKNLELKYLEHHDISEWETIIYNEIKAGRPVHHSGYSLGGGHAFVCDGYDGNGMFHFNWGWGGSHDGYYKLSLMNPGTGGIGSGSSDGYSYGQQIIIGIQPSTGEKAKTKPFLPNSEQFANHTLYSYFLNPNVNSQQANVGFALIDEDNNIIRVLKDAGLMTLKGGMSEYKYIALNLDTETTTLTEGTYRIGTVCRLKGSVRWTRVGYRQRYFLVTKGANNQVTDIQLYPKNDFEVTDLKCTGNLVAGVKQNVTASLINGNEETNAAAYLFASPTTSKGEVQSRATILLKKNETTDLFMAFTPETYGQYNLWLSTDGEGKNVLTTKQVNIIPAPTEPANLTMLSCVPNTTEVSATVRIKNNSTEGYYREIVAILFENLYNDGKLYGTEVLTLPGDIASGSTKTFKFQFHGADSYSQCAILIGYYANHQDANYKQLGNYVWFTTEETPVESINGTPVQDAPIYRIDGTKVSKPIHEGIYISNGKALIAK